ncbi:uncharacterized protein PgNI_12289 [Pyricularia grisea]|uniref:Uncharacterized protein n=1 Tax=Pyricularia grisea TaxID=148305 RepID=A0A6P8AMV1_PYRGI|nr:uncharacterized protein PgNI_12289 [Pyricularia grisea]TLD03344.1 hypothetical protein PgNI_12289 [Pyricularia grisea]
MVDTKALALTAIMLAPCVMAEMRLNVTSISAQDGAFTIECWEVDSSITTDGNLSLGNVQNITWLSHPQSSKGHNTLCNLSTRPRWLFFIKGTFRLTLPGNDSTEAYLAGTRAFVTLVRHWVIPRLFLLGLPRRVDCFLTIEEYIWAHAI